MDQLLSIAEQETIALTAMGAPRHRRRRRQLHRRAAGIFTDKVYTKAKIKTSTPSRSKKTLKAAGDHCRRFQGIDEAGQITTLGRGGSDPHRHRAGRRLQADKCEIYTDVDGVYTADRAS